MKLLILFSLLCLSTSILAGPLNYSLKSSPESAKENQIAYTAQWMNTDQLNASFRKFLNIKEGSEVREVLISSFNFYLPKELKNFQGKYFENMAILEKLSGMNYKKTSIANIQNITFKPHPLKTITAVSHLRVMKDSSQIEDLFSMESSTEQVLVHQTVEKFSDYLDRTDIVTHIRQENDGTRFFIYSIAVLNSAESNSNLLSVTKSAMASKMKDQMKLTPGVFFNN